MSETTTSSPHQSSHSLPHFITTSPLDQLGHPLIANQFERHSRRLSLSNRIEPPSSWEPLLSKADVLSLLPILRTRPPSIPTKTPYPLYLHPDNIHDYNDPLQNPLNQPKPIYIQATTADSLLHPTTELVRGNEQSQFPYNDEKFITSPYGPSIFKVATIDTFPNADKLLNTTPPWYGKLYSTIALAGTAAVTKIGLIGNNVYVDDNRGYLKNLINSNSQKQHTNAIPGVFYPHSSTPTITTIPENSFNEIPTDTRTDFSSPFETTQQKSQWTFSHSPNFNISSNPTTPTSATYSTSPTKQPIITFSNHNSTIDDPFILVAAQPQFTYKNSRWEICGQDICYPTSFIGGGFMAGRVLPIQRGSGLHQPHFTRLHNLLSNGEWVHLFPEGKVQFTPRWDGHIEHGQRDPPKELLPFKWGIGALVAESLLRGEDLSLVPLVHTTARVHPRSAGLPDFGKESSVLVGNNVVNEVRPIVNDYINHVLAYEENRFPIEPQKELLFIQIVDHLKHVMDNLYKNVEKHENIPTTSPLYQPLPQTTSISSASISPRTHLTSDELRNPCSHQECWCKRDEGYTQRETLKKHNLFASSISLTTTASITSPPLQPWFALHPWFDFAEINSTTSSTSKISPAFDEETLTPQLIVNYLSQFHNHIQNTSTTSSSTQPRPLFSHHATPQLYRIKTKQFQKQQKNEQQAQLALSNRIENKYIPENCWGTGKYNLGLDKFDPTIDHETSLSTPSSFLSPHNPNPIHSSVTYQEEILSSSESTPPPPSNKTNKNQYHGTWYSIWSRYYNNHIMTDFFDYHQGQNGLIIDQKAFEQTWDDYNKLDYQKLVSVLQQRYYPDRLLFSTDPREYQLKLLELEPESFKNPRDPTLDFANTSEIAVQLKHQQNELHHYKNYKHLVRDREEQIQNWYKIRDALLSAKQDELNLTIKEPQSDASQKDINNISTIATEDMLGKDFLEAKPANPINIPLPPTLLSKFGYPIDPTDNKSLIRDREYLAEVIMLRNRFEYYRGVKGFDWNGV